MQFQDVVPEDEVTTSKQQVVQDFLTHVGTTVYE